MKSNAIEFSSYKTFMKDLCSRELKVDFSAYIFYEVQEKVHRFVMFSDQPLESTLCSLILNFVACKNQTHLHHSELQIRGSIEDNSKITSP